MNSERGAGVCPHTSPTEPQTDPGAARTSLGELALLFLRLGLTGFGGPAAHIAMMQDEVVRRRKWLAELAFLDLLSAANLIPGPNSTELAIHIGYQRRRWAGLVVAGVSFIVPAMLLTSALGYTYVRYGAVPSLHWLLYGVKPVILAVVLQAIWSLAVKAAPTTRLRLIVVAAAALSALGSDELAVLFAGGALSLVLGRARSPELITNERSLQLAPALPALASVASAALSLPSLFWVFFKMGSLVFGSGYVLLAFLRAELVQDLGWLTEAQLIDAIAVGQVTPGPVFTTATFVGYLLAGPNGALVATAGIFAPAFLFVALSGPLVPRLRGSARAGRFLDGLNAASLALMAVVSAQLARAALVDLPSAALACVAALLLLRFKLNATWLVLGGGAAGWLIHAAS